MAYFSQRIRDAIGEPRASELEALFKRLDDIDTMLENARKRTERELAENPDLAKRVAEMHRTRPAKSARTLLKG